MIVQDLNRLTLNIPRLFKKKGEKNCIIGSLFKLMLFYNDKINLV